MATTAMKGTHNQHDDRRKGLLDPVHKSDHQLAPI
jgi:hypothetical protein